MRVSNLSSGEHIAFQVGVLSGDETAGTVYCFKRGEQWRYQVKGNFLSRDIFKCIEMVQTARDITQDIDTSPFEATAILNGYVDRGEP